MKRKTRYLLFSFSFLLLCLSSCGYRFATGDSQEAKYSITVPYIQGDPNAFLNNELYKAISLCGYFRPAQAGGDLLLQVILLGDGNERIGFKYDRTGGSLGKNLVSVENRRILVAQVTIYDTRKEAIILGPVTVKAFSEYDYVDPHSAADLSYVTSSGSIQPAVDFSLGQLDSVEGAHDDTSKNLYRNLSNQIVQGIISELIIE